MYKPLRVTLPVMMFVGLLGCILSANGIPTTSRANQHCGIVAIETNRAKIIGGEEVALGAFPWIAIIGYTGLNDRRKKWKCGGSLITSRWVLTAAHCVDPRLLRRQKIAEVRLGEHTLGTTPDCQDSTCALQPQVFGALNVVQEPHFSPSNINARNDIALIKLDGEVTFTAWVSPICLPSPDFKPNQYTNGIAAGWGKTETNIKSKVLLSVSLPYIDHASCSQKYDGGVSNSQVCFGGEANKDSCQGDSGGPLMVLDNIKQKYALVGVVSYGRSCGQAGFPGVYTSVTYYLNWIQSVIATGTNTMKEHAEISTNSMSITEDSYTEAPETSIDATETSPDAETSTDAIETSTDAIHENVETSTDAIHENIETSTDAIHENVETSTDAIHENVETSTDAIHENAEDQDDTVIVNVASSSYINCTVGSIIEEHHENDLVKISEIITTPISMLTSSSTILVVESETHIPTSVFASLTTSLEVESEKHIPTSLFSSSVTGLTVEAIESIIDTKVLAQSIPLSISKETTELLMDKQSELQTIPIMPTTHQATTHISSIQDCHFSYYLGGSNYILC